MTADETTAKLKEFERFRRAMLDARADMYALKPGALKKTQASDLQKAVNAMEEAAQWLLCVVNSLK